jgi:hypothetical protein
MRSELDGENGQEEGKEKGREADQTTTTTKKEKKGDDDDRKGIGEIRGGGLCEKERDI